MTHDKEQQVIFVAITLVTARAIPLCSTNFFGGSKNLIDRNTAQNDDYRGGSGIAAAVEQAMRLNSSARNQEKIVPNT